jgi:hypothetical protein
MGSAGSIQAKERHLYLLGVGVDIKDTSRETDSTVEVSGLDVTVHGAFDHLKKGGMEPLPVRGCPLLVVTVDGEPPQVSIGQVLDLVGCRNRWKRLDPRTAFVAPTRHEVPIQPDKVRVMVQVAGR